MHTVHLWHIYICFLSAVHFHIFVGPLSHFCRASFTFFRSTRSHFRRSTFTFLSGHFHFFSGQFCHFHHQFSPYLSFLLFWQKWHIFGASHKSCICQVSILVHEYEQAAKMANYILPITVMSQTPICRSPIYQGLLIFPLILSVYRCYCKTKPRFTGIPDLPG